MPVFVISDAGTAAGRQLVKTLLAGDARLVLLSRHRNLEAAIGLSKSEMKERLLYFRMDPSRASWLKLIARSIRDRWSTVDGLISIADFEGATSIERLSHHQLKTHLRRNLFAPAALVHAMLPVLAPRPFILLCPPLTGLSCATAMSTEGLRGFAQALGNELSHASVHFVQDTNARATAEAMLRLIHEHAEQASWSYADVVGRSGEEEGQT